MARPKKNKYRLKTPGLTIEQSLLLSWCKDKTDTQIIRQILISNNFYRVLKSYDNKDMEIELIGLRIH